jgi:hypothetical protein
VLQINKHEKEKIMARDLNFKPFSSIYLLIKNFSLTQLGVSSGRGSIASVGSIAATQEPITIGIFKGERVAIKKILKKKVNLCENPRSESGFFLFHFPLGYIILYLCSFSLISFIFCIPG